MKRGKYSVHKSLGLLQASSIQDTLIEVGNIEKRVRNLSKEKSRQETRQQQQWSAVCSGSQDECEQEVALCSDKAFGSVLVQQLSASGVRSSVKHLILRNNIYAKGEDLDSSVAFSVPVTCVTHQNSFIYSSKITFGEGNGNPLWYFLPGKSQSQRRLAGYSPWGRKGSDTTQQLNNDKSSCGMWDLQLRPGESRFLTRDQTRGSCPGSTESQPLDHEESPCRLLLTHSFFIQISITLGYNFILNKSFLLSFLIILLDLE